jgi:hypothetical protein
MAIQIGKDGARSREIKFTCDERSYEEADSIIFIELEVATRQKSWHGTLARTASCS